jgi:hypothetical protein
MRCSSFTCRTPSITHSPIVSRHQTLHNRPPSYTIRNTQHFIADLIKAGPGRPRHTPFATHSTQACRPPLLCMCVSASRMALYAANTRRAPRSSWRNPAVVSEARLQRLVDCGAEATGRRLYANTVAMRYRPTAGSRPPLLCMCVRASQKSFFRRQTFAPGHKSGGRKPPVGCTRYATRNAEIQRVAGCKRGFRPAGS